MRVYGTDLEDRCTDDKQLLVAVFLHAALGGHSIIRDDAEQLGRGTRHDRDARDRTGLLAHNLVPERFHVLLHDKRALVDGGLGLLPRCHGHVGPLGRAALLGLVGHGCGGIFDGSGHVRVAWTEWWALSGSEFFLCTEGFFGKFDCRSFSS